MMRKLQNLGRSLMQPVAVLPVAAILMGLGYLIDPVSWGGESQLAAFFIKSGAAILDNLGILFAVGVSYGLSKDKNGAAALSGLVGFYIVTTLLSPGAVAQLRGVGAEEVLASEGFAKINNPFVGIIVGILASFMYNKFYQVKLPAAFSFFSGRRLTPIVTAFGAIVLSGILFVIWPVVYGGLVSFGTSVQKLGPLGAGIYAFFNRLLIPTGLHHALNAVFWFDIIGIDDIPVFLGGAKSIANGVATVGVTGMYQAGFFPIMMFGLPGAALAMYHTAKDKRKQVTLSLLAAGAFASFFTGVTEPIEFAFMFLAPLLYLIHALLTGISVFIAASLQWIAGFGFSAGAIDMFLSSRNPLAVSWYMLIPMGLVFFVIYYFVFKFFIIKFNLKTPGREDDIDENEGIEYSKETNFTDMARVILEGLGGKDNIENLDHCVTRLRVDVKDYLVVDESKIKRANIAGVIRPSKSAIQVIVGPQVQFVYDELKKLI